MMQSLFQKPGLEEPGKPSRPAKTQEARAAKSVKEAGNQGSKASEVKQGSHGSSEPGTRKPRYRKEKRASRAKPRMTNKLLLHAWFCFLFLFFHFVSFSVLLRASSSKYSSVFSLLGLGRIERSTI